ncbi:MAG: cation diffusion facilitator family transporter [Phycisphaerae bacterium]
MNHDHRPHAGPGEGGHEDALGHHVHRGLSRRRLLVSMALTGGMMVVEFVGGVLTGSLALVSDAGHMFTHVFALGLSYFAIRVAARPAAPEQSFGLYRAEILAALLNGLFLAGVTVYIAYEAVMRFLEPVEIAGLEMLLVAVGGLAVNLVSALLLWGASHGDLNVRSAFLHMLGDTLSSVAVVAGAGVIMTTGVVAIDPVLSLVIAGVIGWWSIRLLAASGRILLEATPPGVDLAALEAALVEADPHVRGAHDLHVWEITSGMLAMTAILEVDGSLTVNELTALERHLGRLVHDKFGVNHAIFQAEAPIADDAAGAGAEPHAPD